MLGSAKIGSLSSSLLARKGQARPAMRSQGFGGFAGVGNGLDDLGWNDMGVADADPVDAAPVSAGPHLEPVEAGDSPAMTVPMPQVLVERETLEELIAAPAVVKTVSVATAARMHRETTTKAKGKGKAAFTLRLDADRHLRLRLTSAVTNRSAQQLVTEALDALLKTVVEVDALVAQLPASMAKR